MRALGVPHLLAHLRGDEDLTQAVTASKTATRHFAKRQLTWFRHQTPDAVRLTAVNPADRLEIARSRVSQFLLTEKGPKA
jgi:tRNA dimethylallyltransferase